MSYGKNYSFQILKTGFQMFSNYFQKNGVGLEKIRKRRGANFTPIVKCLNYGIQLGIL